MSKKSQENYKAAGLCILCGGEPRPERMTCTKCAERCRNNTKKSREDRIKQGLCCVCGERPLDTKRHCRECATKHQASATKKHYIVKDEVFEAYGGYVCKCCGEKEKAFLTIDHVNNDGAKHRKEVGTRLYHWLKNNEFPDGFQVLCMNCQWGKRCCGGVCPHQKRGQQ